MQWDAQSILLPRRTSALQQVPWRWWHILVGLAPILGFRGLQMLMNAGWLAKPSASFTVPLTIFDQLWFLGWTLFIARRNGRRPQVPHVDVAFVEAAIAVPVWVTMIVTLMMVAALVYILAGRFEPPTNPVEKLSGLLSHFELICLALVAVVLAPVCEETFFRGLLHNYLRQRTFLALAIAIQGFIFGFLHSMNLTHSIITSFLGIILGLVYEWRRTLVASIFVHALQNFVAMMFTVLLLGLAADSASLGVFGEEHGDGCRVAVVVAGSAAEESGLREGDVITSIDEQPVADGPALATLIKSRRPGDVVTIEFRRDGEVHRVQATLKRKGW
jgi:membrane protease YdiL (CAAX protease family)